MSRPIPPMSVPQKWPESMPFFFGSQLIHSMDSRQDLLCIFQARVEGVPGVDVGNGAVRERVPMNVSLAIFR